MPGVAFHSLLNQPVQVSLAAMPAKGWGQGQNACSAPLVTLTAPTLYRPAQGPHVFRQTSGQGYEHTQQQASPGQSPGRYHQNAAAASCAWALAIACLLPVPDGARPLIPG